MPLDTDRAPDTDRSAESDSGPSTDAFALLVQLQRETRNEVRAIRTRDLPALAERVARLETHMAVPSGGRWSTPVKAGAGVAAIVPLFYGLIQLAQSVGWLPPPAPGAAPPPAITAAP